MRLTLRTLLAWLDDTLSPAEVREIGKQVNESPFAKDLVERVHKVTRQRRLTVPPWSGADGTDPNLVAGYLDNELDPEQVAEFERKCLTSDVHLAEVASIHQILSLIGQKAKVPNEARVRMYHLVKGREAMRAKTGRADKEEISHVAQPIQPWVTPPPPQRPLVERFGPPVLVLVLMTVLVLAAWKTLAPPESAAIYRSPLARAGKTAAKPGAGVAKNNLPANPDAAEDESPTERAAAPPPAEAKPAPAETKPAPKDVAGTAAEPTKTAEKNEATGSDIPPGYVARAKKPNGLLLRYSPERRDWERITDASSLREQDRLLNLEPFRSSVETGRAVVDLVGETEVWLRSAPKTLAARLALARGKVVLRGSPGAPPVEIEVGGTTVAVTPSANVPLGAERVNRRSPGEANATTSLRVYVPEGRVSFGSGADAVSVEGPATVVVGPDGKPGDKTAGVAPGWVTETGPTQFDQKVGEQFLQFFRADRPIVSSLVEASEEEQKDVCRLAISALKAVGDISYIVPILNKKGDPTAPTARRAAIAVLRSYLAEGPDAVKALRQQLDRDLGGDRAATTEKLLVGYTAKEAGEEATYSRLVQLLGTTDDSEVGVRELALENLKQLTGRDSLDYDPEKPTGKGLQAWKDLLRDHELKAAGAGGDAKK